MGKYIGEVLEGMEQREKGCIFWSLSVAFAFSMFGL